MKKIDIDISGIKYNPTKIQSQILNAIEIANDGNVTLNDPTNPFMMLMESNIQLTNSALEENVSNLRKQFPSLAGRPDDLYHHLSDMDYINIFSVPATGTILFTVNLKELIDNGYDDGTSISVVIPWFTTIKVSNIIFTTLNDIRIKYLKASKKIYVEQLISDNELAFKDLGVLKNDIITDINDNKWIIFETLVKQIERNVIEDNIIIGLGFNKEFTFNDQFHHADVMIKNANTNNAYAKIKTTNSDIVFDQNIPTAFVKIVDSKLHISIPEIYLLNGTISGNIKIVIYTSKGKINLPINKIGIEDYVTTLGDTTKSADASVGPNITILASSNYTLDGGRNQKTLNELRRTIIDNSIGDNKLPITYNEISERSEYNGFKISKVLDSITDRFFMANKNLMDPIDKTIKSKIDMYMNKFSFILDDLNSSYINVIDDSTVVIKSGTVFKNDNGKIVNVSNVENDAILKLTGDLLTNKLLPNKYFYTPFYYICSVRNGTVVSSVFDLDNPKITNHIINSKVPNNVSVNIDKYTVYSTEYGYKIVLSTTGNKEFENIDKSFIKAQLAIKLPNSKDSVYFYTTLDKNSGYLTFTIDSNFFINNDGFIHIENGESLLVDKSLSLDSNMEVIIYTNALAIEKTKYAVTSEILFDVNTDNKALSKEYLNINFGHELKYLWNMASTDYTERKFKEHHTDVPLTYVNDVYNVDPKDGSFFTVNNDCGGIDYDILHKKGDVVKNSNEEIVYIHKKGDPIIENGEPIIDNKIGVIRNLDILMLDFEYVLSNNVRYVEYSKDVINTLRLYLDTNMSDLNNRLLDNTKMFYSPLRSNNKIEIKVGYKTYSLNPFIKPMITLYVNKDSTVLTDKIAYVKSIVGLILHKHLDDGYINMDLIKKDIVTAFGESVVGIKIDGLDGGLGFEIFNTVNNNGRLTMRKKITYNVKKEINIEYDIDLVINKI